jgi:hypothetical protein
LVAELLLVLGVALEWRGDEEEGEEADGEAVSEPPAVVSARTVRGRREGAARRREASAETCNGVDVRSRVGGRVRGRRGEEGRREEGGRDEVLDPNSINPSSPLSRRNRSVPGPGSEASTTRPAPRNETGPRQGPSLRAGARRASPERRGERP